MSDTEKTVEIPRAVPEDAGHPDSVVTQEIPAMPVLPPHLARDPILTMPPPELHHTSILDYCQPCPRFRPPVKRPAPSRRPGHTKDRVLAAMAAGVVVMGVATYVMVESGWRSDMPQSQSSPVPQVSRQYTDSRPPADPSVDPGKDRHQEGRTSPAYIPQELPADPRPAPASSPAPQVSQPPARPSTAPSGPAGPSVSPTVPVPPVSVSPSLPAVPTGEDSPSPSASAPQSPSPSVSAPLPSVPSSVLPSSPPVPLVSVSVLLHGVLLQGSLG